MYAVPMTKRTARPSTALYTDHYELTALEAALRSGIAGRRSVFEVFGRRLPPGRRYAVLAGVHRAVDSVMRFRFGDEELAWLEARGFLSSSTLEWLSAYRFSGSIDGYRDGELFFPGSPVLTVEATFGEALILETILLSVLNHDVTIASAAARMVVAAQGRQLIDGGSRRTHEEAAVAAALAAAIVGFAVTSNLEAGHRFGLPTAGTTMHAFILAHLDERAAFRAQVAALGADTTLLVDTFDIEQGIRHAIEVAGPRLGAVRLDSGDPVVESGRARTLLDDLGAAQTRILVSGDLDEYRIAALADSPVDAYMVGTKLVTGSGAPAGELVYKLVAVADHEGPDAELRSVAKLSMGKLSQGGRKEAGRRLDADGRADAELAGPTGALAGQADVRMLQVPLVRNGEPVSTFDLDAAKAHHQLAMAELSPEHLDLADGPPAFALRLGNSGP
jgi:nicotinate phosphoribosyltransferase